MLVMDVSLFLFVVSQECSFSHAVKQTRTQARAATLVWLGCVCYKHSQLQRCGCWNTHTGHWNPINHLRTKSRICT